MYNSSQYIGNCLKSVFAQTYKDIEIILVDDCSTDDTLQVARGILQAAPPHLQAATQILLQERNKGQSAARNRGILASKGEFLFFLDSDDTIEPTCLETLAAQAEKYPDIQMVVGDYAMAGGFQDLAPMPLESRCYTSEEIIPLQLRWQIYTMVWNKLVSKEFLTRNRIFFQEGIIHEDNLWSFCCAFCLDKIAVIRQKTYTYFIRPGSTERSGTREFHEEQLFEGLLHLLRFIFLQPAPDKKDVGNRADVYLFLTTETRKLILSAWERHDRRKAYRLYRQMRRTPHWRFRDVWRMPLSRDKRLGHLHFSLPDRAGFCFYLLSEKKKYHQQS